MLPAESSGRGGAKFSARRLSSGDSEIMEKEACKKLLDGAPDAPAMSALEREKYCSRFGRAVREDASQAEQAGQEEEARQYTIRVGDMEKKLVPMSEETLRALARTTGPE